MPPLVLNTLMVAFLVLCWIAIVMLARTTFWSQQARAVLMWRSPFMRGSALRIWAARLNPLATDAATPFMGGSTLRNWAATIVEQLALNRLTGQRTGLKAAQLAAEVEEGAMRAMMPLAQQAELERIVACPETGQGLLGATALEALAIAAHLRASRSPGEQKRIHDRAIESSSKMAPRTGGERNLLPLPCSLQGQDGVCCAYAARPLLCRPLHARSITKPIGNRSVEPAGSQTQAPDVDGREQTIAEGFEIGLTRALKFAGLDADIYELNSALAVALDTPDAAERWANGEKVFARLPAQSVVRSGISP